MFMAVESTEQRRRLVRAACKSPLESCGGVHRTQWNLGSRSNRPRSQSTEHVKGSSDEQHHSDKHVVTASVAAAASSTTVSATPQHVVVVVAAARNETTSDDDDARKIAGTASCQEAWRSEQRNCRERMSRKSSDFGDRRWSSLPDVNRPIKHRLRIVRCSRSVSPTNDQLCIRRTGTRNKTERVYRDCELEVLGDIGKGFYGVARKVVDLRSGRILVLKEMLASSDDSRKTFEQELCLLRRVRHPNVLRFAGLNFHRDNVISFLVEYMSGGSLSELIHNKEVDLPWHRRIGFAKDIAMGMSYLHSLNVIHRDLNSHNCLLRSDYSVVVADFGLSCAVGDDRSPRRQSLRSRRRERYKVVGSPYWMAPEMLKIQKYDERVDVFSFGIVLCEIIGRVEADPDYLPRTSDFGLNVLLFKQKLCGRNCPKGFLEITVNCCDTDPRVRPAFSALVPKLRILQFTTDE